MNRELLKQMGQAAIDFANGESVQYLYLTQWIDIDETHCFCPDKKYRVKPKPRIIWVYYPAKGDLAAYSSRPNGSGYIPYRELTPEEREELKI